MRSVMNVIPEGPGSVSPRMKHRWPRVRGRAGPSSTQWPGFSAVPWTEGSGFESLGPMYATSRPRTSRYHSIAFRGSETTIAIVSTPRTVMRIEMESELRAMNLSVSGRPASSLRRPASEEALHQPSLGLELPQSQPGLAHVVLEARVRCERFGRRHAEAADDPPQDFAAGVVPADLQVGDRPIPIVRIPGHVEPLVQLPEGRRRGGPAQVRQDQEPLAGDRSFFLDNPEDDFHVLRDARRLRGLVQAEIRFRAVRPVLRDREAFREEPSAVEPLQRAELPHTETRREVGAQASEGFGRGDRIREPGVEGHPLPRQCEGE